MQPTLREGERLVYFDGRQRGRAATEGNLEPRIGADLGEDDLDLLKRGDCDRFVPAEILGRVITGHAFPIRAFGLSEDDPDLVAIHSRLDELLSDRAERRPTIFGGDLNLEEPQRCLPSLRNSAFRRVLPSGPTTQPLNKQFDHIFATRDFSPGEAGVIVGKADHFLCWADLELTS